ncbi:MAG: tRNA 2-thiouridine(34) synthase MnmA [Phycisphaerae bacterium]
MSRNGKVIVAMSGGVDSSVAACLLKERGYDCVGVFMRVGANVEQPPPASCAVEQPPSAAFDVDPGSGGQCPPYSPCDSPSDTEARSLPAPRRLKHGCCSATDAMDARTIAARLDIPFYALNFEKDFDRIIDYFVNEYGQARTPNPCVMCNIHLKFGKLLRYADMMDAEFVATGHYARIIRTDAGNARLARGVNTAKDQSYVLFGIRREDLARCMFPIGDIADKADVRAIAATLGLRVHDKPDSQEICFVPNNDYRQLVQKRRPDLLQPGEMRDASGRVVGQHDGVAAYTIGQRHGLGIAMGKPYYVTQLNVLTNTVTVGPRDELSSPGLIADAINWLSAPPPVGAAVPALIKIRHMHTPTPGTITVLDSGHVEARFDTPQPAVTPGQAAVFYDGDLAIGGGWIREAIPS